MITTMSSTPATETPAPPEPILRIEQTGSIVYLTLTRPKKYNAHSVELNIALREACMDMPQDASIVVLRGEGKHFCVGSDLKDLYQVDREEALRVLRLELEACMALLALPQLTIAVMHGKCFGGGAFLPLYCDYRLGRPGMEIALPEVGLGWVPPYGIERLNATVPNAFALEMLLTGRVCGDREAVERGWLHQLVTAEEEQALLERFARIPDRTLRDTLSLACVKDFDAIRLADDAAMVAFVNHFDTDHARKQIAAFVEKKR
jgi:enoyl-CoA hydratase/carnithine racemase